MRQLKNMIDEYQEIPFKALIYLTGECYYGGKVTDDWDRRVLNALLNDFYNMSVLFENYKFSSVESYVIPNSELILDIDLAINYIASLPDINDPELFGLHSNASITSATIECNYIISCLLNVGSSSILNNSGDKNKIV